VPVPKSLQISLSKERKGLQEEPFVLICGYLYLPQSDKAQAFFDQRFVYCSGLIYGFKLCNLDQIRPSAALVDDLSFESALFKFGYTP
jgi:hypothetical protein